MVVSVNGLLINRRSKKHISLTSLIDVVFILLLFFMLTSSFSQWKAIELQSPISASKEVHSDQTPQVIVLAEDGRLRVIGELPTYLIEDASFISNLDFKRSVIIVPKEHVSVQLMVSTLSILKNKGVEKITLGGLYKTVEK